MENSQPLPQVFHDKVREIIAASGDKCRDWSLVEENGNWELRIPKIDADGFEVTVVADEREVSVFTEYLAHSHFTSDGDHGGIVADAMGLVRDLLSPIVRVRVFEVGGSAYRGDMEILADGTWKREWTTSLFVIPWFRRKSERIYLNHRMPVRDQPPRK